MDALNAGTIAGADGMASHHKVLAKQQIITGSQSQSNRITSAPWNGLDGNLLAKQRALFQPCTSKLVDLAYILAP
jgi:hypothetical protein